MLVHIFRIFAKKKVQELCLVLSPVSCAGDIGLHFKKRVFGILFGVCQGDWATRVETNRLKMTAGLTTRDPVHIFCLIYFFSLFLCQLRDESLPIKTFALRRQTSPLPLTTFFAILHFQNTQKRA